MELPNFLGKTMREFFTYEEQINKLLANGLTIQNEVKAIEVLRDIGYFNLINGYSDVFKNGKSFIENSTFEDIFNLYDFDRKLRSVLFNYSQIIETKFKSLISYEFSKKFGLNHNEYLHSSCFASKGRFAQNIDVLLSFCKKCIVRGINSKSENYKDYFKHYSEKHNAIPLWILMRGLTFGQALMFYDCMLAEQKLAIANIFNLTVEELSNLISIVIKFRNIAAHGERVYCATLNILRLSQKLVIVEKLNIPKTKNGDPKFGRRDFFALMITFKYLLCDNDFLTFFHEVELLINTKKLCSKAIEKMGLSGSWKKIVKMKISKRI